MKKNKGIKITLIILTIILLSMISFVGIYVQDKNQMKNIMPEYLLERELKGHRRVELKVNEKIAETIKYDAQGNVITEENKEVEVAKTEEKKVNADEILTPENYKKSKQIIENRLKTMQVNDYIIRQNKENGTIILELPEEKTTDRIVSQLSLQGKFEIVDADTNEVLMTNSDIKSVQSGYGTIQTGETAIFININFNEEGTEKFKNITNTYVQTVVEKEQDDTTNEIVEEDTTQAEEEKPETETKEISIKIDDVAVLTSYFNNEISNGVLQLTVGSSTNATTEEMQEYILEANSMSAVLDAGKMPIVYELQQNKYILSNITINEIEIAICVLILVLVIGMVYFILKYKVKGILGSIALIGYIAILLIAVRIFNVKLSIGALLAIVLGIIINYFIISSILKQTDIISVIKKYAIILIPTLIIAIVFTFMNIAMGSVIFWAIIISILYNLSITNIMLKD